MRCDGETFLIFFLNSTRFSRQHNTHPSSDDDDDGSFFSGRRGISKTRFLSFSFPFGRSVDKTTTTTTTHPSGGVRRGPLRSFTWSSSSRARERERKSTNHPFGMYQRVSLSLSLVDQKTCSQKSTFFVGKTDRPFRLFLPSRLNCQNSLTPNERKQTNKKKKQTINVISLTVTKNRFCARRRRWWCRGA